MDSNVGYVRHVDEESGLADSSVFDQRYSAHQSVPAGYTSYGLETSVVESAHHQDEEFAAPARVDQKVDYTTTAVHGMCPSVEDFSSRCVLNFYRPERYCLTELC